MSDIRALHAVRDFIRAHFQAQLQIRDDNTNRQQHIHIRAGTLASLTGLGIRGDLKQRFRSFFSGRWRMTLRRDSETGSITATRVSGLTLAHSYLGDAEAYRSAARQLDGHAGQFSPKYFLLCHAIELALKSYILAKGGTERETKKIKHDLIAAWSRAVALGLQPTNAELHGIIQQVAPSHAD